MTKEDQSTIRDLFEDADILNYKALGAHADVYDRVAAYVMEHIFEDMSIAQVQKTIWDGFYYWLCVGQLADDDKTITAILNKEEATHIFGDSDRFIGMAKNIRYLVYGL